MVCRGEFAGERERVLRAPMAMGSERSKPLHNFTLPRLRWGGQRYMRCMKVAAAADSSSAAAADRRSPAARSHSSFRRREPDFERRRWFARDSDRGRRSGGIVGAAAAGDEDDDDQAGGGGCGIEAVRQKLMFDLRAETDKMKDELLREEVESVAAAAAHAAEEAEAESGAAAAVAAEESRPWNLRTRRAACKAPIVGGGGGGRVNSSPSRTEDAAGAGGNDPKSSPRVLRGNGGGATQKTEERAKFAVALKRNEIEEDFMAMVGHRPPRRFKKRPKNVQKQLDLLFPGLWLTEISVDTYKVDENPENGKR